MMMMMMMMMTMRGISFNLFVTSSSLAVLCRSMQLHIVELGLVVEVGELRRFFCI